MNEEHITLTNNDDYVAGLPKPPRVRFGNSDADQSEYGRFLSEHFVKVPTGYIWCYHVYEHAVVSWMGDPNIVKTRSNNGWSEKPTTWFDKERAREHWNSSVRRGGKTIYKTDTSDPVEMFGTSIAKGNWYGKRYEDAINAYQKAHDVADREWEEARIDPKKFYEESMKNALSNYALEA